MSRNTSPWRKRADPQGDAHNNWPGGSQLVRREHPSKQWLLSLDPSYIICGFFDCNDRGT